jgi:hypothetical protein
MQLNQLAAAGDGRWRQGESIHHLMDRTQAQIVAAALCPTATMDNSQLHSSGLVSEPARCRMWLGYNWGGQVGGSDGLGDHTRPRVSRRAPRPACRC